MTVGRVSDNVEIIPGGAACTMKTEADRANEVAAVTPDCRMRTNARTD